MALEANWNSLTYTDLKNDFFKRQITILQPCKMDKKYVMEWLITLGFGCPDCWTRVPIGLMMGRCSQDRPGDDSDKQPPKSQLLKAKTKKHDLFLHVHLKSVWVPDLSFLLDLPWWSTWYLEYCQSVWQRVQCSTHYVLKVSASKRCTSLPPRLAKASRVAEKYRCTMCLGGERNSGTVSMDSNMGSRCLG